MLRARLSDAKFSLSKTKAKLESRVPRLGNVVYHNQIGTQLEMRRGGWKAWPARLPG